MPIMEIKKILVVDDDAGLRELLQQYLTAQGYKVETVADGVAMENFLSKTTPDLIILDLMLPGEDGLVLARKLRGRSDLPIIMLSARGEDIDRIVGLEVGADDYLAKPFNPRELLARIRALLRRSESPVAESVITPPVHHSFGSYTLNLDARELHKKGVNIPLTAGEFNLLRVFVEHPNHVLNRDYIMDRLRGYERSPFDRSIDVRITRLRRKIEDNPNSPLFIRTVWGEGYLFHPNTPD